jgi:hypothetical protein
MVTNTPPLLYLFHNLHEACVQLKDCIRCTSCFNGTMHRALSLTLHGTNGVHMDVAIMILNVIKVEEILKEISRFTTLWLKTCHLLHGGECTT